MYEDFKYLYGQLNNYVEYLKYEITSDNMTITNVDTSGNPNKIKLAVNPANLLTLKQIETNENSTVVGDGQEITKTYGIFAYNPANGEYDIKVGDTITIDTTLKNYVDALISDINTTLAKKQDTLKSGKNIKTINGKSLLGEGNLTVITDLSAVEKDISDLKASKPKIINLLGVTNG